MSEEKQLERACTTCTACLQEDYGASNWTTEGTYLHCLRGLNPALDGQEEPWREPSKALAAALDVAQTCAAYRAGVPAHLDCELHSIAYKEIGAYTAADVQPYAEDVEIAELLAAFLNRSRP